MIEPRRESDRGQRRLAVVERHEGLAGPHAVEAANSIGVPPQFLIAQSALETGWGKSEIRRADGSPSYNLFGVKAGRNWQGETVEVTTTEYVNGEPQQMREKFRVYNSYAESFNDYAPHALVGGLAGAMAAGSAYFDLSTNSPTVLRGIHAVLDDKQRSELADLLDRDRGWWRGGPYR